MKRHLKLRTPVAALAAATVTAVMLAVATVGVASASAAVYPKYSESGKCTDAGAVAGFPTKVWYWNASGCTGHTAPTAYGLGTGEYADSPFVSTLASTSPKPKLETVGERVVECESEQDVGELTGEQSDRTSVEFTGKCHAVTVLGDFECHSTEPAAPEGTIITKVLSSKLVWIDEATKKVGVALSPETGTNLAKFVCKTPFVEETLTVTGSVIGAITPTETKTNSYALTFDQTKGVQNPVEYEEDGKKVADHLETKGEGIENFGPEQSGQTVTSDLTTSETGEILTES